MEKLEEDAAAKFINALIKSVQTLCHGYLEFNNGIEIIGHLNLSVDKGSSLHYILEEKVCKNEENSTLFISNSFHAQNQKSDSKSKGKDSDTLLGTWGEEKTSSSDLDEAGKLSAISSISSALSKSHEKNRSGSTSSAKESENVHSKPSSSTAKRKVSDDHTNDIKAAKSSRLSSSPSPVSHFLSHSPHDPSGSSSPVESKPSLRHLHAEDSSGTVLPQTAVVTSDSAGDLGVNLAGSVLERVDDQSNSDLQDRGDDSDGDLEVTFIKEEYVEGEPSACQFENSGGQQYGRGTQQRGSSSDMSDGSLYPVALHSQSASSTFVPSAHDMGQHYGPSTSSQPQPGASGIRGAYPPESHDSSACDLKLLEATQLFKEWLIAQSLTEDTVKGMTIKQLDKLLGTFYREVRKRDGTPLKEHALRRVRSGLMKYLSKLLKLQYPISTLDFQQSNKIYTEMLTKMPSKPTVMLTRTDCTLIRSHKALSIDSPTSLLKKVWFELQLHFGARRWSPREMWPEVFVFVSNDDDDSEYVMLDGEQLAESHLKPEVKDMLTRRQMLSTGGNLCPVEALKLYLAKREHVPSRLSEKVPFLQKPNPLWTATNGLTWYTCSEISLGKNHNFIRELAEEVKLEAGYTNMSLCFGDPRQYYDCWP